MKQKKAYVLIFTVTMLSLVMILTHQLLRLVQVGVRFDRAMVNRERAEILALGGINIAIAQLTLKKAESDSGFKKSKLKKSKEKIAKKEKLELKNFLQRILPNLNRWQVFNLKEEIDGIDGRLKICTSCENGKININQAFDFKKQDFKPAYKKILQKLKLNGSKKGTGQYLKKFIEFLKKRKRKIDDLSELQTIKGTPPGMQFFYEPPRRNKKPKLAKPNEAIAIQDLFTIWTDSEQLEALFLSDALCSTLGFQRPAAHDSKLRKEVFKKIIKNFKPATDQNKQEYWKNVRPLYKTKGTFKIKNNKIFSSKFEPTCYSVLSSGKVGNVEQRILAIIEKKSKAFTFDKEQIDEQKEKKEPKEEKEKQKKKKPPSKSEQPQQQKQQTQKNTEFRVVRIYWI